uniref:Uncharacterized protein n=1 Tax=Clytia hemisphaerica TaxID=252671 RepID=A0A7M5XQ75_9CNID
MQNEEAEWQEVEFKGGLSKWVKNIFEGARSATIISMADLKSILSELESLKEESISETGTKPFKWDLFLVIIKCLVTLPHFYTKVVSCSLTLSFEPLNEI